MLPRELRELAACVDHLDPNHLALAHAGLSDPALERMLLAAAAVAHGAELLKWRKEGREKPHRRFVRVTPSQTHTAALAWGQKRAALVRADAEIFASCFQGKLTPVAKAAGFQIILDKRMLFLSPVNLDEADEVRALWVGGLNALASGEVSPAPTACTGSTRCRSFWQSR